MLKNRSVPANAILPHLTYTDVAAAVDWLTRAFGFAELAQLDCEVDEDSGEGSASDTLGY